MRKKILLALTISLCATSFLKAEIFNLTSNGFHNFKTNNIEYIIEVPGVSQEELFKSAKLYVTSIYDSYSKIATDIENEVIIINSSDDKKISAKNHARESNLWRYNYQYKLSFEDGKVIFEPTFKNLVNINGRRKMDIENHLFTKKGKKLHSRVIKEVENRVNEYVKSLEDNIKETNLSDSSK